LSENDAYTGHIVKPNNIPYIDIKEKPKDSKFPVSGDSHASSDQ